MQGILEKMQAKVAVLMSNRYKKVLYLKHRFQSFMVSLIASLQHLDVFMSPVVDPLFSALKKQSENSPESQKKKFCSLQHILSCLAFKLPEEQLGSVGISLEKS